MAEQHVIGPCEARSSQPFPVCGFNPWVPAAYPLGWNAITADSDTFFRRPDTITGDHINALPYWFEDVSYYSPVWAFRGYSTDPSHHCENPPSEVRCDGSVISRVTYADIAYEFSREDKEFCDSMSILKAQASLRKGLASIPMLFRERQATVKTLASYATGLLAAVRKEQRAGLVKWYSKQTRRSSQQKRRAIAQEIANRHLEFVFGVLPLIRDIEGVAEYLNKPQSFTRTGRGRHSKENAILPDYRVFNYGASCVRTKTQKYSVRTGLRCDIKSEFLNDLSLLGFNPIYFWYDATPLSFVVGWVSNFNLWLQSLDPIIGLAYRTGFSTRRTECAIQVDVKNEPSQPGPYHWMGQNPDQTGYGRRVYQDRIVHDTMPPIQSPAFMDNTSVFAALAALSLTLQRGIRLTNNEIRKKEFRYRGPRPKNLPPIRWRKPF